MAPTLAELAKDNELGKTELLPLWTVVLRLIDRNRFFWRQNLMQ